MLRCSGNKCNQAIREQHGTGLIFIHCERKQKAAGVTAANSQTEVQLTWTAPHLLNE